MQSKTRRGLADVKALSVAWKEAQLSASTVGRLLDNLVGGGF